VPVKRHLFTPGPTPVPPEVLAKLGEPVVHHRAAGYRALFGEVLERLKEVFRTASDVLVFTASGTGARFGGARANIEAFTETRWVTLRGRIAQYPF